MMIQNHSPQPVLEAGVAYKQQDTRYFNLGLNTQDLALNNLTLKHLKEGDRLDARQRVENGMVKVVLCKGGMKLAVVPQYIGSQLLRMRAKGHQFSFTIKSVESLPFMPPHKIELLVTTRS